jgi:DNA-directed RNA polymerase II subunit RPB7
MYYIKDFEHSVTLPPEFLVPGVGDLVQYRCGQQLEGTCTPQHGYLLALLGTTASTTSAGVVQSGSGAVRFDLRCRALVCKPVKGQVVDAAVTSVSKVGVFCAAGPVTVFVSSKLLPREYGFDGSALPPQYVCHDVLVEDGVDGRSGSVLKRIAPGDHLRVRIMGTKLERGEIFCIGTIREDCLGPIP